MSGSAYQTNAIAAETDTVIDLVGKAARNVREREGRAADAVNQVQVAIGKTREKLHQIETRTNDLENALNHAHERSAELTAALQAAHEKARGLKALISGKEAELVSAKQRAIQKEERAEKAVADLHRIGEAVRRELPVVSASAT